MNATFIKFIWINILIIREISYNVFGFERDFEIGVLK
jgi:hypothetical protein